MKILKDKNDTKDFVKVFITIWMTFISLSPYFLASFALMSINDGLGSIFFDYLFNFLSFSIFSLFVLVIFNKRIPKTGKIKEFIIANSKKVFFGGIIFFYLTIIFSTIINLSNLFPDLLLLMFSFFVFPFLFFMFNVGKKIMDKINKAMDLDTFSGNSNVSPEEDASLMTENNTFLKYQPGNKDVIKTKSIKT